MESHREPEIPEDTVATGDLFKLGGSKGGLKTWTLRRFYLAGPFLTYYNKKGTKKGQWDIRGCTIRTASPEECRLNDAIYGFTLTKEATPHKPLYVMCASNEKSRGVWLRCIKDQIEEYKNEIRIHIRRGENVIANEIIKKNGMLLSPKVRVVVTNYPKIMLIDPKANTLKEQRLWSANSQPSFTMLSESKFKLTIQGKDLYLEDMERGASFWESLFRRVLDMTDLYIHNPSNQLSDITNIGRDDTAHLIIETTHSNDDPAAAAADDEDELDNNDDTISLLTTTTATLSATATTATNQNTVAAMEIGDLELSATNIRMLQSAIGNVRELVTAISLKILAIDDEDIDFDFSTTDADNDDDNDNDDDHTTINTTATTTITTTTAIVTTDTITSKPSSAVAVAAVTAKKTARKDRNERRKQLQKLKDKIQTISINLETLVERSLVKGFNYVDMSPISKVIDETAAMLIVLYADGNNGNANNANNGDGDNNGSGMQYKVSSSGNDNNSDNDSVMNSIGVTHMNINPNSSSSSSNNNKVVSKLLIPIDMGDDDGNSSNSHSHHPTATVTATTAATATVPAVSTSASASTGRYASRIKTHRHGETNINTNYTNNDNNVNTNTNDNSSNDSDSDQNTPKSSLHTYHDTHHSGMLTSIFMSTAGHCAEALAQQLLTVHSDVHDHVHPQQQSLSQPSASQSPMSEGQSVPEPGSVITQSTPLNSTNITAASTSTTHDTHIHTPAHAPVSVHASLTAVGNNSSANTSAIKAVNSSLSVNASSAASVLSADISIQNMLSSQQKKIFNQNKLDLKSEISKLKPTSGDYIHAHSHSLPDDLKALQFTKENFDEHDVRKRPPGWHQVRLKRVIRREEAERKAGVDQQSAKARRRQLEQQEELQMLYDLSVAKKVSLMEEKIQRNPEPVFPREYQKSMPSVTTAAGVRGVRGSQSQSPVRYTHTSGTHSTSTSTASASASAVSPSSRPVKVIRHTPSQRASAIAVKTNPLASPQQQRRSDV